MIINGRHFEVDIIRKNISPVFSDTEGSSSILEIALLGTSEKDLRRKLSQLRLELQIFEATISSLDDEMLYVVDTITATQIEEIKENHSGNGHYTTLILDFRVKDIYDEKEETITNILDNIDIDNPGLATPINIKGKANGGNLIIVGLEEEFSMKLNKGDVFEVNSYDKIILVNGKNAYEKMTSWYFPRLKPGINNIGISGGTEIELVYRRRWA